MQTIKFSELPLSPEVLRAVEDMGFEEATPIQSNAIPEILTGRDVTGQAQTGTGKTAAFGIPAIELTNTDSKDTQVLVLCPTRELALQVKEQIHQLSKYKKNLWVTAIYGGESYERQFSSLRKGTQIVVGTPGRIMDHIERKTLNLKNISMVILDEADEMLNMGFREDMEEILSHTGGDHQTLLFSATMSKDILNISKKFQVDPKIIKTTRKEITNDNIEQSYFLIKRDAKLELTRRLIEVHHLNLALVFCNTKSMVDNLVNDLQGLGYSAEGLHGDMRQSARNQVMNRFRSGQTKILVATDVAARGIDVSGVDAVINYDFPQDLEYYVHRIGRTGRAGEPGKAFLLMTRRDRGRLKDLERYTKVEISEGKIPGKQELHQARIGKFKESLIANLKTEGNAEYEAIVDDLKAEGYQTHFIISALIRMQLGNIEVSPYDEEDLADTGRSRSRDRGTPRRSRREKRNGKVLAEEGMTRLFLNLGKKDHVSPNHIVGAIASEARIPGRVIGQIDMYDKFSFVEIPHRDVSRVLKGMKGKTINHREANLEIAK